MEQRKEGTPLSSSLNFAKKVPVNSLLTSVRYLVHFIVAEALSTYFK